MDSPKAYAPLGYGVPGEPIVIREDDFKNDVPLPSYGAFFFVICYLFLADSCLLLLEERAPLKVSRALAATFSDTELQRPNSSRLSRPPTRRVDNVELSGTRADPVALLVQAHGQAKRPLVLGKSVLSETGIGLGRGGVLDKYLKKRERDRTGEGENGEKKDGEEEDGAEERSGSGSSAKKARTDKGKKKVRSARDSELYHMEDTVRPENLLMMVDSSLVDTPERRRFNEQNQAERAQRTADED